MIGRLEGILAEKNPPQLLIDINGVGYELEASMNTFYKLPETGKKITLYTQFIVREDSQKLFAFIDKHERHLFRDLIKVNGVGPKLALTILSSIDPQHFLQCIRDSDTQQLIRMPGVGKKTAERLIVEMRDKLKDWTDDMHSAIGSTLSMTADPFAVRIPEQEAVHALVALGYKPNEASRAIAKLNKTDLTVEEMIRQALKGMVD